MIKLFVTAVVILIFSGCAQKVIVKTLKPSSVNDKDIKQVSILSFKNDTISLSSNIESQMNKVEFNGKKYFNIVNRKDTNRILEEQRLQDSGLVNTEQIKDFGLSDVKTVITGEIISTDHNYGYYTVLRTGKCAAWGTNKDGKKYCARYYKYYVDCIKESFSISANVTVTKVSNSDILFKESYTENKVTNSCGSNSVRILKQAVYEKLSEKVADKFVTSISPSFQYFKVELIDDEDTDYSDEEEILLENGLKLLELNRVEKAKEIFKDLVSSTKYESSTALYNYGVTLELTNDIKSTLKYYKMAESINLKQDDINEIIIKAVERATKTLQEQTQAKKQIDE